MFDRKIIFLNLAFFSIIVLVIIFHYFSHFKILKKEIISYIQLQANSIAKRIEISATNIFESQKFIKNIIEKNLESQARFIDLLNSIESFKEDELKDFAEESNLKVIAIFSKKFSAYYTSGYLSLNDLLKLKNQKNGIIFLKDKSLILYKMKGFYSDSIIITGIYAKKFFEKRKKLSLKGLIQRILNQREDIKEIKILKGNLSKPEIKLKDNFYIVKIPFEAEKGKIIYIKIDAYYPIKILQNFKHNLYIFIFVMIIIGLLGNIFIYYLQKNYISKIRKFEKEIAKSEKDAALGRSAALIAHELRNPINAIGMGIQRIMFETDLTENSEHYLLLKIIREEIDRINNTIENFLKYSKPITPNKTEINLRNTIESVLLLFKNNEKKISVHLNIPENIMINVDKELFTQLLLNLIKNVFENEKSSYLKIYGNFKNKNIIIFENDGFNHNLINCDKIFEPYFTTKTRGSGLGLAIVKKIVEAHNGKIYCQLKNNIIKFIIEL